MANTTHLGLPQNSNWATGEVAGWAKTINDETASSNAFLIIDDWATTVDANIDAKAPQSTTYTKTEVDDFLSAKANSNEVYAKTETYSQGQIDAKLSTIQPAYPLPETFTLWNAEYRVGSVTPAVTLPSPDASPTHSEEIRYIFTAATTGAAFTAPAGFILATDDGFKGLSAGNTISLTGLTVGSIYEVSFAVLDSTHITMIYKEWKTA